MYLNSQLMVLYLLLGSRNMESYTLLGDLTKNRDNWTIKVRITRLWEPNFGNTTNWNSCVNMILIDEEATLMQATITNRMVQRFKHQLQEGNVYIIKNFTVKTVSSDYRVLSSDYQLTFMMTTTIKRVLDDIIQIPKYGFEFANLNLITERLNQKAQLTDIIGVITSVKNKKEVGFSNKTMRQIEMLIEGTEKATVALWGSSGDAVDWEYLQETPGLLVAIVTSNTVSMFKKQLSFSTTNATKVYINLEIPEVQAMIERSSESANVMKITDDDSSKTIVVQEEAAINRKTIQQLLEIMDNPEDEEPRDFTVRAKIEKIQSEFGWYYIACNRCQSKLKKEGAMLRCDNCDKNCIYPIMRYKIQVEVNDNTETTTFVIFDNDAKKLLKMTAEKMSNKQQKDLEIPEELHKIIGKRFLFKINMNEWNLKKGYQSFRVTRIFLEEQESQDQPSQQQIIQIKKEKETITSSIEADKESNSESQSEENLEDDLESNEENIGKVIKEAAHNEKEVESEQISNEEFPHKSRSKKRKMLTALE